MIVDKWKKSYNNFRITEGACRPRIGEIMNYEEARVYLEEASKYGSVLGLDICTILMERLGNPQDNLKFIHISGTNGKGSVLAYLSTILTEAGYRVGRYISPYLYFPTESGYR